MEKRREGVSFLSEILRVFFEVLGGGGEAAGAKIRRVVVCSSAVPGGGK